MSRSPLSAPSALRSPPLETVPSFFSSRSSNLRGKLTDPVDRDRRRTDGGRRGRRQPRPPLEWEGMKRSAESFVRQLLIENEPVVSLYLSLFLSRATSKRLGNELIPLLFLHFTRSLLLSGTKYLIKVFLRSLCRSSIADGHSTPPISLPHSTPLLQL